MPPRPAPALVNTDCTAGMSLMSFSTTSDTRLDCCGVLPGGMRTLAVTVPSSTWGRNSVGYVLAAKKAATAAALTPPSRIQRARTTRVARRR